MADELIDRLDDAIDAVVARGDASAALRDPELAPLVRWPPTCGTTRAPISRRACGRNWQGGRQCPPPYLPNIREGFATVTPYLWVPDRGMADFLIRVFDAVETRVTEGGRRGAASRTAHRQFHAHAG